MNYEPQLTENAITQSMAALACLVELRETYRANSEDTPYLLAAKTVPHPLKRDADIVQELYSTTGGLVRKVSEIAHVRSDAGTRTVSTKDLKNLPALGTFSVSQEEISHHIKYFKLRSNTILDTINLVEKELKIDIDKRNLTSNVQDCVFSEIYYG